jgi:adenine deaminase
MSKRDSHELRRKTGIFWNIGGGFCCYKSERTETISLKQAGSISDVEFATLRARLIQQRESHLELNETYNHHSFCSVDWRPSGIRRIRI